MSAVLLIDPAHSASAQRQQLGEFAASYAHDVVGAVTLTHPLGRGEALLCAIAYALGKGDVLVCQSRGILGHRLLETEAVFGLKVEGIDILTEYGLWSNPETRLKAAVLR